MDVEAEEDLVVDMEDIQILTHMEDMVDMAMETHMHREVMVVDMAPPWDMVVDLELVER